MLPAQDTIRYVGKTLSNVDYHHGQLSPAVGVHNIQVMRANREHPEDGDGFGWTYNHAPVLAYWNNNFYVEYLSDPVGEHVPPGQTLLLTSKDGYNWSKPTVLFPPYKIPDGTTKEGNPVVAKDTYAAMHQRMGFYVSKKNKLLALGYYGIVLGDKDDPNDGKGVGRVVREIKPDNSFGAIYFIHYNKLWNEKNTSYPFYKKSKDKDFVAACDEILSTPLLVQQWNEESDHDDPLIPVKKDYKALSYYHLPDGRVVGLWKYALTAMSSDDGKTWQYNPVRAPGFVNANAKIWGQRTSDGKYATVYNPSEFRWPLAISTSSDGIHYTDLLLVHGEITSMRYGGNYKSYGPQYVRGILEGNGSPADGNLWVTYSVNKEDIWVSCIPVPVTDKVNEPVNEVFAEMSDGKELLKWNIYSPLWAPVGIEMNDGEKCLALKDRDPFDYAKAEHIFPVSKAAAVHFKVAAAQHDKGVLNIELQNPRGNAALRLTFGGDGYVSVKAGYRQKNIMRYVANESYDVIIQYDVSTRFYHIDINGKRIGSYLFFNPVEDLSRIVFQTGDRRYFPTADTPTDQMYDLPNGGESDELSAYYIYSLNVR